MSNFVQLVKQIQIPAPNEYKGLGELDERLNRVKLIHAEGKKYTFASTKSMNRCFLYNKPTRYNWCHIKNKASLANTHTELKGRPKK